LCEVAERAGCEKAFLVQRAVDLQWDDLAAAPSVAITAGASAPEILVDEIIEAFRDRFDLTVETISTAEEDVTFMLPRVLRESAA
jgi:4-hydroxy-3-methylbut-2-enyl diphosphate reductase